MFVMALIYVNGAIKKKFDRIYKHQGKYYGWVRQIYTRDSECICEWQPMIKFLWFYIKNKRKHSIWRSPRGFRLVKMYKEKPYWE